MIITIPATSEIATPRTTTSKNPKNNVPIMDAIVISEAIIYMKMKKKIVQLVTTHSVQKASWSESVELIAVAVHEILGGNARAVPRKEALQCVVLRQSLRLGGLGSQARNDG